MNELGPPAEMAALMAELEELLQRHMMMIIKLNAVTLIHDDTLAALDAINRRQVEIINRVHMEKWVSDTIRPDAPSQRQSAQTN